MRKEFIFAAAAGAIGIVAGFIVGKVYTEKKIEKECEEPRIFRLYPEEEPEVTMDDFKEVAVDEGYISEEDTENLETSIRYETYMKRHGNQTFIISPDYEKRSDDLNNALDMVETETLLYFPDENVLVSDDENKILNIEEHVGDLLMKYGFADDPMQTEIEVFSGPYERHYIVKKELQNSVMELYPNADEE